MPFIDRNSLTESPSGIPHLQYAYGPWNRHPLHGITAVYYLERGDGIIKIGRTNDLIRRRRQLVRENGPMSLVAWERGSWDLERARHKQFWRERIEETEWFNPEPRLIKHIVTLRPVAA